MNEKQIGESLKQLRHYVEEQDFMGYDLYDTLLSPLPFHWLGKWGPVLATQFQKRNPVNIRPLLGIPKQKNPKGIGLFIHACILRSNIKEEEKIRKTCQSLFRWLEENRSKGYSGSCWGYNFPWAGSEKHLKAFTPSAVVTGFVIRGIHEYYLQTKDPLAKELIIDASNFIMNDLQVTENESGICFSYTPLMKDMCYNASLLAAETLSRAYSLNHKQVLKEKALSAAGFVMKKQHDDGHWNYSRHPVSGKERIQIDFHQGYIIESLHEIRKWCDVDEPSFEQAISKGLEFYSKKQFNNEGRSLWRYPKEWPVDIHNQAQGIITFSRFSYLNLSYLQQAKTIADWTIRNMQDRKGYFYHQVRRGYRIKIPYMRWSQAWMMLALATLMSTFQDEYN